jgi:murein L,D-transpeptidase YafK
MNKLIQIKYIQIKEPPPTSINNTKKYYCNIIYNYYNDNLMLEQRDGFLIFKKSLFISLVNNIKVFYIKLYRGLYLTEDDIIKEYKFNINDKNMINNNTKIIFNILNTISEEDYNLNITNHLDNLQNKLYKLNKKYTIKEEEIKKIQSSQKEANKKLINCLQEKEKLNEYNISLQNIQLELKDKILKLENIVKDQKNKIDLFYNSIMDIMS